MAPPSARFFLDETDLALGRALATARSDVVHPGHTELPEIPEGTLDPDWLPIVSELGLVVITRDKRIRSRSGELLMYKQHGIRGVFLTGKTSQNTWDSLSVLARRWDDIEELIAVRPTGPWAFSATAGGALREIPLPT